MREPAGKVRGGRQRSCGAILAGLVICCSVWIWPAATVAGEVSQAALASLWPIAESYPCAALAVLYTARIPPGADTGTIYLNAVPSAEVIAMLARQSDASLTNILESVSLSPYTPPVLFIEVRWSRHALDNAATILTTEAQLVDQVGQPLQPAHRLQLPTRVLMSGGLFRLLGSPGDF